MAPLPERMRPRSLAEYVGQKHLVGEGCVLRNMIESGNLSSFILWGPPGVGKTTLAGIIAAQMNREFFTLSAVTAGVKDVRDIIDRAKGGSVFARGAAPVLFIDEIHRFNKAQQDALLGAVESGVIVLIGATTENPSFEVITPLLSRCQVFVLKSLGKEDLLELLNRAVKQDEVLSKLDIQVGETVALLRYSGGDARKLLNILEIVTDSYAGRTPVVIDNAAVAAAIQENLAIYDKGGEMHYDIISA
ncbi:MAG: AAA family ATPase, partial [Bacteroidales bacterium]|nr:AAA family ATPase [Bacteroidales bacterium]